METGPRLRVARAGRQERHGRPARRRPRPGRRRARCSAPSAPSGQRCTSTSRLIVHPDVAGELVDRVVKRAGELRLGDPRDPAPTSGPVITRLVGRAHRRHGGAPRSTRAPRSPAAARRSTVDGLRRRRVLRPHRAHRGAARPPHRPGGGVRPGAGRASRSPTSTTPSTWSTASSTGCRPPSTPATSTPRCAPSTRIDTGIVYVNAPTIGAEIPLPFGGTKHTGNGFREAGTRGIEQFSQVKTVYVDYSGRLQKAQIDTHPLDDRRSRR